jgi:hypothetical protein
LKNKINGKHVILDADYRLCITPILHYKLWGYKVEITSGGLLTKKVDCHWHITRMPCVPFLEERGLENSRI